MLVIGDELLDGRVTDTNSVGLARRLAERGLALSRRTTITDDIDIIIGEARAVAARGTHLCVVSGGLGPTSDDLTAEAFAMLAGVELVRDPEEVAKIERWLEERGRPVSENQRQQADRPDGARIIPNRQGTAPGFEIMVDACRFVAVPGIPREFDAMVADAVTGDPSLGGGIERRTLYCFGLIEADVDARVAALRDLEHVRLGFRVKFPEIHVTLTADTEHRDALDDAVQRARAALTVHVFSETEGSFGAVILDLLRARNATLAVAESCTGGLVGDLLTDVPGSSDILMVDVVAYADRAKLEALGVDEQTLAEHGAVSEATVLEMAHGTRRRADATYGIAVSGIAGPGGGTPEKPVGTVWLAAVGPELQQTRMLSLPFERRGNKVVSAYSLLDLLRRALTPRA